MLLEMQSQRSFASLFHREEPMPQHCSSAHITTLFDTKHDNKSTQEMSIHASVWRKSSSSYFCLNKSKQYVTLQRSQLVDTGSLYTGCHHPHTHPNTVYAFISINLSFWPQRFTFLQYKTQLIGGQLLINDTILSRHHVFKMCSTWGINWWIKSVVLP